MELNFSELANTKTMNPYESFNDNSHENHIEEKYWEKSKEEKNENKKKRVSFNDILSNMNLVVNKQGVLQFMTQNPQETQIQNNYNPNNFSQQQQYQEQQYQKPQYQKPQYQEPQYQKQQYQKQQYQKPQYQEQQYPKQKSQQNKNSQPIDPAVKHSYIYNKYFKDYTDMNIEKHEPRVPKTIEEYNKMLLEDKIKQIEHRKMIEQVKSKKMMFISESGASSNPRNVCASKNNLRMMNFR